MLQILICIRSHIITSEFAISGEKMDRWIVNESSFKQFFENYLYRYIHSNYVFEEKLMILK